MNVSSRFPVSGSMCSNGNWVKNSRFGVNPFASKVVSAESGLTRNKAIANATDTLLRINRGLDSACRNSATGLVVCATWCERVTGRESEATFQCLGLLGLLMLPLEGTAYAFRKPSLSTVCGESLPSCRRSYVGRAIRQWTTVRGKFGEDSAPYSVARGAKSRSPSEIVRIRCVRRRTMSFDEMNRDRRMLLRLRIYTNRFDVSTTASVWSPRRTAKR